jgi:hypothetical protein
MGKRPEHLIRKAEEEDKNNNEAYRVWAVARNVFRKCVHFSRVTVFVHDLQGIK